MFTIETFNAIIGHGFKQKVLILDGLNGFARIPVRLSSTTKGYE